MQAFEFLKNLAVKGGACTGDTEFLGFPHWYEYLQVDSATSCMVQFQGLDDFILVALAVVRIGIQLAGYLAVGWVIYGGFRFITSQGDPEGVKVARNTVLNAVIGIVIVVLSATIVSFVATRFN